MPTMSSLRRLVPGFCSTSSRLRLWDGKRTIPSVSHFCKRSWKHFVWIFEWDLAQGHLMSRRLQPLSPAQRLSHAEESRTLPQQRQAFERNAERFQYVSLSAPHQQRLVSPYPREWDRRLAASNAREKLFPQFQTQSDVKQLPQCQMHVFCQARADWVHYYSPWSASSRHD